MNRRGYEPLDATIREWAERHHFTLFDSIENMPDQVFRTVYLSSESGECFQIWVDPPQSDHVALHAADVETRDDEEFRQDWRVPVQALAAALDRAVEHVHGWMSRR